MKEKEKEKPSESIADNSANNVCAECLQKTTEDELIMFGGLCEECSGAFDDQ